MMRERPEHTGRSAEHNVAALLDTARVVYQRQHRLCPSIYPGEVCVVDFLVRNAIDYPHGLAIEVKWQETNGSADEKFPYVVENIRQRFPCPAVVIVCGRDTRGDGGGARQGAIDWLRRQVDGRTLVGVFSIEEFMRWLRHLRVQPFVTQAGLFHSDVTS
jgi:hypothetical protein